MEKTLQQLKDEAANATLLLRAAEQAAAEAERKAKEELRRAEEQKRIESECIKMDDAFAPVIAEAGKLDWSAKERFVIHLNHNVDIYIQAEEQKISNWRSAKTGRFQIIVEYRHEWGREKCTKRYPQKKDGSGFNLDKIIKSAKELMANRIAREEYEAAAKAKRQSASELAIALREELGVTESKLSATRSHYVAGGRYTEQTAPEGCVYVNLGMMAVNAEQARLLIKTFDSIKDQLKALKGESK